MDDINATINDLEGRISKLYSDYGYLVSSGSLLFGDKHYSTAEGLRVRGSSDASTSYSVMRFNKDLADGIEIGLNIWTNYGEFLVYKQHGTYKFVYMMPYASPPKDMSLADYFNSIPSLEGEANAELLERIASDLNGHNIEPVEEEFLSSKQNERSDIDDSIDKIQPLLPQPPSDPNLPEAS